MRLLAALLAVIVPAIAWAIPFGDAYDREVLSDSPIAYWRLNEPRTDETTAYDDSGNGHHGTYETNGLPLTQRGTPALSLCPYSVQNNSTSGGSQQRITVPDDAAFDLGTGNFTMEFFWRQLNNNTTNGCSTNGTLISKGTATGGFPYIHCQWTGTNDLVIAIGATSTSIDLADDAWHMETIERTSTTNVNMYVDGSSVGTIALAGTESLTNASDLKFWYNSTIGGGSTTVYRARLDNISFYGTAIGATAIADHWTAANTVSPCYMPDNPYEVRNDRRRPRFFGFITPGSIW